MTRKHFQAIAECIRDRKESLLAAEKKHSAAVFSERKAELEMVAIKLADTLSQFNGNFDRARFLAACEPKA